MIGPVRNHRHEQVTVTWDELVPDDHFLRTVDALIDFSFIETIIRHVWETEKEKVRRNKRAPSRSKLYKLCSQTIERSFADAKELHGFRYARRRGRPSVQEQAFLTAATQNIKKMALLLARRAKKSNFVLFFHQKTLTFQDRDGLLNSLSKANFLC